MTIKELENLLDISRANVRFYEKEGLIKPKRKNNGYRDYSSNDIENLEKIIILRNLGVSIETIKSVIDENLDLQKVIKNQINELENNINDFKKALNLCQKITDDKIDITELGFTYLKNIEAKENENLNFKDLTKDTSLIKKPLSKKDKIIVFICQLILYPIFILFILSSLIIIYSWTDNPMKARVIQNAAENYLKENYSETDYTLGEFYGFDMSTSYFVNSPSDESLSFVIYMSPFGTNIRDTYNINTAKQELLRFIDFKYTRGVHAYFNSDSDAKYDTSSSTMLITNENTFSHIDKEGNEVYFNHVLDINTLTNASDDTVYKIGNEYGHIAVYIPNTNVFQLTDEATINEAVITEILDLKNYIKKNDIPCYYLSLSLDIANGRVHTYPLKISNITLDNTDYILDNYRVENIG